MRGRPITPKQCLSIAKLGKARWNKWAAELVRSDTNIYFDLSGLELTQANFKGFIFPAPVSFANSSFVADADFIEALFEEEASFYNARFLANANFSGAQFNGAAHFAKAKFACGGFFVSSYFGDQAWFVDADFDDFVEFSETHFTSDARFNGATFQNSALFLDVKFYKGAWFTNCTFLDDARFSRAKFEGRVDEFSDARFDQVPDFRTALVSAPPHFRRAQFRYSYRADIVGRILGIARDNTHAASYRRMKQFSSEAKDHDRELLFFSFELRAKRIYETKGIGPNALNMAYGLLSDYGLSVGRPMFALFALIAVSASLWAGVFVSTYGEAMYKMGPLLVFAATNSALLIGAEKWAPRLDAIHILTGSRETELGLTADVLAYGQSAFSLLLIFFVGLALRNRFRIGGAG